MQRNDSWYIGYLSAFVIIQKSGTKVKRDKLLISLLKKMFTRWLMSKIDWPSWHAGYACALAVIMKQHDAGTEVKDATLGMLEEFRRSADPNDVKWIEYAHGGPKPGE